MRDDEGREPEDVNVRVPINIRNTVGVVDRSSQVFDLSGQSDFGELFGVDLRRNFRGGQVQVVGQITDSPSVGTTYQYAYIEANIIGYVGSQRNVLRRIALGGVFSTSLYNVNDVQNFTRIAVEARKIIDGASGSAVSPTTIAISVAMRFNTE